MSKQRILVSMAMVTAWAMVTWAGPPLPLHSIEGNSGIFLTSTAYMANPPEEEGAWLGLPSVSATGAFIGEKDFQAVGVTENVLGRIELGYALERLGLGDWPDDVHTATGGAISVSERSVLLHNFNVRLMAVQEGDFDCAWMPAITIGTHFKWNNGLAQINEDLGGLCDVLGADRNYGHEMTLMASKTIADVLPRPVILSGGMRFGDAIHTGFLGFAGEWEATVEGSVVVFLTDRLAFASEYRQKTDQAEECTVNGAHLVKAENDWWDLCLAYVINDHMTVSGGWASFGNVLNHREDNVWAFQLKYEF